MQVGSFDANKWIGEARRRSEHPPLLLDEESGSPVSCSAMLGGSSSWSHFVMAMYSLQSGCVSRTSATCVIRMRWCFVQGLRPSFLPKGSCAL